MSLMSRLVSSFFTALPAFVFFAWYLRSGWVGHEYWWKTYMTVLIVLITGSLSFGLVLPSLFQKLRLHHPWLWILVQGLLAWIVALFVLGLLNLTPVCIGQDNGDGNNDFALCNFMTALSGIVYTPLYLGMLLISSAIGHWILRKKLT